MKWKTNGKIICVEIFPHKDIKMDRSEFEGRVFEHILNFSAALNDWINTLINEHFLSV